MISPPIGRWLYAAMAELLLYERLRSACATRVRPPVFFHPYSFFRLRRRLHLSALGNPIGRWLYPAMAEPLH